MRLQQPIQEVGIHSRYLGDAESYEDYDGKKLFGARALSRAPIEYLPSRTKFDNFEVFTAK